MFTSCHGPPPHSTRMPRPSQKSWGGHASSCEGVPDDKHAVNLRVLGIPAQLPDVPPAPRQSQPQQTSVFDSKAAPP
eukprot:3525215-Amphidinium_carterae.1